VLLYLGLPLDYQQIEARNKDLESGKQTCGKHTCIADLWWHLNFKLGG